MKDTQMLLMMEGVIETVRGVTETVRRITDSEEMFSSRMEVVIDPGSPLRKMLGRQFEQGGALGYRVLVSESYWFKICSFSAQVNSIGINEHEVSVGLIVMTKPVWKRVSKQIWNRRKVA